MNSKTGIDAQAGTIVSGAPNAYAYLAERFGARFTALHKRATFLKRCELGGIPHMYQVKTGGRKAYASWALEKWYLGGFTDTKDAQ